MQDLTEKILSLDLEVASVLKDAKAVSMEAKKSADTYADKKMNEAQQLFEKEKKSESKVLSKRLEDEKKHARISLDQKMKAFDERVKIDAVVKHLVSVAKDKICP